ncbi:MAG: DUF4876 domain-containing protein [Bacteroidaceae bacterium]|nr:DUF4876 domain-containing protein [Bacteroidaceae bacterium]
MKKNLFLSAMLMAVSTLFFSCSNDEANITVKDGAITLEMPINVSDVVLNNFEGTATNVQSGEVTTLPTPVKNGDNYVITIPSLSEGRYNLTAKGNITFVKDGVAGTTDFEVNSNDVTISQKQAAVKLVVNSFKAEGGFVLSEICTTGTTTPQNKNYNYDAYFVITNNSDVVLYADSVALIESQYQSGSSGMQPWDPDVRPYAIPAGSVFMIPGNGTQHPVAPGESIVIANNAMDHRTVNENSYDLTSADFEVYLDNGGNSMDTDYDTPNLEYIWCYTNTIWIPSVQQNRSYAIARMKENKETFLANHSVTPTYTATTGKIMESKQVQIPNEWVLDAVNLGTEDDFGWYVISETLDAGFVAGRANSKDTTQRGTSIKRKKDSTGKYIDTNNSTNDLEARQVPSMKSQD